MAVSEFFFFSVASELLVLPAWSKNVIRVGGGVVNVVKERGRREREPL